MTGHVSERKALLERQVVAVHKQRTRPMIDRFWDRVSPEPNSGCWLWIGAVSGGNRGGYAQLWDNDKGGAIRAHKFSFETFKHKVPNGLVLDHRCRVRSCVNPDHLDIVTNGENIRRGLSVSEERCRKGHKRTKKNTMHRPNGNRECLTCKAEQNRQFRMRSNMNEHQRRLDLLRSSIVDAAMNDFRSPTVATLAHLQLACKALDEHNQALRLAEDERQVRLS